MDVKNGELTTKVNKYFFIQKELFFTIIQKVLVDSLMLLASIFTFVFAFHALL
jgi:hypothetical protein